MVTSLFTTPFKMLSSTHAPVSKELATAPTEMDTALSLSSDQLPPDQTTKLSKPITLLTQLFTHVVPSRASCGSSLVNQLQAMHFTTKCGQPPRQSFQTSTSTTWTVATSKVQSAATPQKPPLSSCSDLMFNMWLIIDLKLNSQSHHLNVYLFPKSQSIPLNPFSIYHFRCIFLKVRFHIFSYLLYLGYPFEGLKTEVIFLIFSKIKSKV